MDKRDYFLWALKQGACKKRAWVNSMFAVTEPPNDERVLGRWYWNEKGQRVARDADTGDEFVINTKRKADQPLCDFREAFVLQPGDLPNYQGDGPLTTTYGNVFVNYLLLVLPFGDLFPFQTGHFSVKKIEEEILERLIDNPEDDDWVSHAPNGKLYVRQYLQFSEYALSLVAYASMSVVSVTPKALQSNPKARKRRQELLEENKDKLTDPIVAAKIGKEMEALDREWLEGDAAYDFYEAKGKKGFGAVRNKLFYLFGSESAFTDGSAVTLITKSLEEGIDPEKLPEMINGLRYGSYSRGSQTQLGGESTKTIYRMVGTIRIEEDDCGTSLGIPVRIKEENAKGMIDFWVIDGKQSVLLTKDNIESYIGKDLLLRSPVTCKTEGRNVCKRCVGEALAELPDGIPAAAASIGGIFLNTLMKIMHSAGSVSTKHWDHRKRLN